MILETTVQHLPPIRKSSVKYSTFAVPLPYERESEVPVSFDVVDVDGLYTGKLLQRSRLPDVEQVGFTQVSDEPVSSATETDCGGVPMET